jgi:hypothetical protein
MLQSLPSRMSPQVSSEPSTTTSHTWLLPAGLLVAAAAAIVMWVVWPRSEMLHGSSEQGGEAATAPVPGFVLETEGEAAAAAGPHRYSRETAFEWILRPETPVEGVLGVRAFAFVGESGLSLDLSQLSRISETGEVRISGKIGDLGLEPGTYTIALVVGRPAALPDEAAALGEGGRDRPVSRLEIVIEG